MRSLQVSGARNQVDVFTDDLTNGQVIFMLSKTPRDVNQAKFFINELPHSVLGGHITFSGTGNKTMTWTGSYPIADSDSAYVIYPV